MELRIKRPVKHLAITVVILLALISIGNPRLPEAEGQLGVSSSWIQLAPVGGPPSPRRWHSSVYDQSTNRLIVFGGCTLGTCSTTTGTQTVNDVWVLTNANGLGGTPTWLLQSPSGGPPPERFLHAAVYDQANNRMVIWSGNQFFYSATNLNDVWVLTNANALDRATGLPATPNWVQLFPIGAPPPGGTNPGRQAPSTAYDPVTNRMIVFGGATCDPCQHRNDVAVLTNANGLGGLPEWIRLSPTGGPPSPRYAASALYDVATNRMIVFGGTDDASPFNDAWILVNANGLDRTTGLPVTPAWIQLATAGGPLPSRVLPGTWHGAAFDPGTNRMVMYGASVAGNDVWVLANANGTEGRTPTWSQITPTGTPPSDRAVFHHFNLYHPSSNRMIFYGGATAGDPGTALNDSWVLTNANGAISVQVDIKPGSFPNTWICRDVNSDLVVAILSTTSLDARTVDALSVRFGKTGVEAGETHKQGHLKDVNNDGRLDVFLHFRFGATGFSCNDIPAGQKSVTLTGKLTGKTTDGTPIQGEDSLLLAR